MKILLLSKRQYTSKDLLDDNFGRLFELPKELANLGHDVCGVCLSYRSRSEGKIFSPAIGAAEVTWYSWNLGKLIAPGAMKYFGKLKNVIEEFRPDIIFACSDAIHIIIGKAYSNIYNIPLVVDLYDNYESFSLTKIPGVLQMFRNAVKSANGVVCVSRSLAEFVRSNYSPKGGIVVIENGVSPHVFKKLDKEYCRKKLGLPIKGKIIGTAGALAKSRGIDLLFEAFSSLSERDNTLSLALVGPIGRGVKLPYDSDRLHYLGEIDHGQIPEFLNSLDVAVVCNRKTAFGDFCYPQKIAEILACKVPVVAANTGDVKHILGQFPNSIYTPEDLHSLECAIKTKLVETRSDNIDHQTWAQLAYKLDEFFIKI